MRLMTVLGTRPEIIRLSCIIHALDQYCEQTLVHTGQNYDPTLSDIFFQDLGVRAPDIMLHAKASTFEGQLGQIFEGFRTALDEKQPERLLVLGDTNSALVAFVAARHGIPVYHMEAGNRCYDDRVPEEINRRVIDHCSNVLMPYTRRSAENLVREGIERNRIYVTGNPIYEVLQKHQGQILASNMLDRLGLERGRYLLVTLHRSENVDHPQRLQRLCAGLQEVADLHSMPVVMSLHPRTEDRMRAFGLSFSERMLILEPLSLFDFLHLEQRAFCVLTDSGTVQEECCIYHVPAVTLRDTTERPETIECGSNILAGSTMLSQAVEIAMATFGKWTVPREYLEPRVSSTVTKIVLGYERKDHGSSLATCVDSHTDV